MRDRGRARRIVYRYLNDWEVGQLRSIGFSETLARASMIMTRAEGQFLCVPNRADEPLPSTWYPLQNQGNALATLGAVLQGFGAGAQGLPNPALGNSGKTCVTRYVSDPYVGNRAITTCY